MEGGADDDCEAKTTTNLLQNKVSVLIV